MYFMALIINGNTGSDIAAGGLDVERSRAVPKGCCWGAFSLSEGTGKLVGCARFCMVTDCIQVSSVSPVTALVSVRSPTTSFAVVNLNGSVDWMVAQRRALLAWTGRSLSIKPTINTNLVRARLKFWWIIELIRAESRTLGQL